MREVPASIGQRLVWFLERYRSESSSVSCPAVFRIRGDFDDDGLQPALETVVARHAALRTTLSRRGRDLVQCVHDRLPVDVTRVDLPHAAEDDLQERLAAELRSAIPVERSPSRFTLWRLGTEDRVLCFNMHHLISDAWSCGVVINDVITLLGDAGDGDALDAVGWQYDRFSEWQHEQSRNGELAAHVAYWKDKLDGMSVPALPRRPDASSIAQAESALATASLPGALGDELRAFARDERTTLFSVVLALYYLALHAETGEDDLSVASFFANRTRPEVRLTVGFFANMLVLRTVFDTEAPFRALLRSTQKTVMDAVVHQAVPCQMLSLPSLLRSPGRVNDVVFQMLPDRSPDAWAPTPLPDGVEIDTFRPGLGLSRFGLNLTVIPRGDRVDLRLSYAADRFAPGWAERFLDALAGLAATVLADPDAPLSALAGAGKARG